MPKAVDGAVVCSGLKVPPFFPLGAVLEAAGRMGIDIIAGGRLKKKQREAKTDAVHSFFFQRDALNDPNGANELIAWVGWAFNPPWG